MLFLDFNFSEDLIIGGNAYSNCEHYAVARNVCGG